MSKPVGKIKLTVSICFSVCSCLLMSSQSTFSKPRAVDNNPVRIKQAERIIADSNTVTTEAKLYIAQTQAEIDGAHKLEGEAREYHKNLTIKAPLLKGAALNGAKKQYAMDLRSFSDHVKRYNLHTLDVRKNYGHCKASLAAYEKLKKELELHCTQFHMQDVPPPHICITAGMSAQEASKLQNQARENSVRVAQAEHELENTERRLQSSIDARGLVDKNVMENSALALKEQDLAAEFGRLKEEHRQLDVERNAIARSGGSVAVPTVKAKIKH